MRSSMLIEWQPLCDPQLHAPRNIYQTGKELWIIDVVTSEAVSQNASLLDITNRKTRSGNERVIQIE